MLMLLVRWWRGEDAGAVIGGTLLNMAVFGAMLSYAFQAISFILLRKNLPHIDRPYRRPVGVPGALLTLIIALVTIVMQLQDPVYRDGVIGAAIWFAVGIVYFALIGRHHLVFSPEEEFALREREKFLATGGR